MRRRVGGRDTPLFASVVMPATDEAATLIVSPSANLSEAVMDGLQALANKPCAECKAQKWELTKRETTTGWQRRLQCMKCGVGIGPAFAQREHPNWQDYPAFDLDRNRRWNAERKNLTKAVAEAHSAQWWADYDRFLTTPEWFAMRERVMKRANHWCEACLEQTAKEVHHLSYSYGFLPPAYFLVAVCQNCHSRIHTEGDEWGPRQSPADRMAAQMAAEEDPYDGEAGC